MNKETRIKATILKNIRKNVNEKSWPCLHENCNTRSINSHLLQQKGILDNITEEGHLIEIKTRDHFQENQPDFNYKRVGIKKAISLPLFCNHHDSALFKEIETHPISFNNKRTQLLFSYRSLCGELRKKEKILEINKRSLNSNILRDLLHPQGRKLLESQANGLTLGIMDMTFFKTEFENDLSDDRQNSFTFRTYKFESVKICVSAIFSPLFPEQMESAKTLNPEEPLSCVFVNVIPQPNDLYIIVGYHNKFTNSWIEDYIHSWGNLKTNQVQKKLTDLIGTRVESWSMAPSLLDKIPISTRNKFLKYWDDNAFNLSTSQTAHFNLFADTD